MLIIIKYSLIYKLIYYICIIIKNLKIMTNKELFNDLYDLVKSNAKGDNLDSKTFQDVLKSSISLAYTNGYYDKSIDKPMDRTL